MYVYIKGVLRKRYHVMLYEIAQQRYQKCKHVLLYFIEALVKQDMEESQ